MAPIAEVSEVEAALSRLAAREDGPYVVRLAREPGRRGIALCTSAERCSRRASDASENARTVAGCSASAASPRPGIDVKSCWSGSNAEGRVAELQRALDELKKG
jgi:uncharacterized protein YceH (UPF0502 family)